MLADLRKTKATIEADVREFLLKTSKDQLSTMLNADTKVKAERVIINPTDKNLWSKILFDPDLEVVYFAVNYIAKDETLNITVFSGSSFYQEVNALIPRLVRNLNQFVKNRNYSLMGVFWNHESEHC